MLFMDARLWISSLLSGLLLCSAPSAPAASCGHWQVGTDTMRRVMADINGYDTAAAPNQARFVADFLFGVAAEAAGHGGIDSFQIQPQRFFEAWLTVTGREADDAPVSMRRVLEYRQRFAVDIDPAVDRDGARPRRVLAVRVVWDPSDAPDGAQSYSYEDTRSDPAVRIRQQHDIRYLLIDFGDFIAYENMHGISGRPTSGGLGALFKLLGMAEIESVRLAVATDGFQINRSRVRKWFGFTTHAVITPDGTAERGIPDSRPDYRRLAERLDRGFEIALSGPWPEPCD